MSDKSNKTNKRHRSNINSDIENDIKSQKLDSDSSDSMDDENFTPKFGVQIATLLLQSHQQHLILA